MVFKPMEVVRLVDDNAALSDLAVVYSSHMMSRQSSVALVVKRGESGTHVGWHSMRHYDGPVTDDIQATINSIKALRSSLGKWAPPLEGWDD
jgi:hypothetical protein